MNAPFKNKPDPDKERGAVLLTTILLMAVMAAIMVAVVDDIRYSTRRSLSVQTAHQISWLERGAEDFASVWLGNIQSGTQKELSQFIRTATPVVLPIDGGRLSLRAMDGRNCFNINQLADEKTKDIVRQQFSRFLQFLEFDTFDADNLAASIQDWVDIDDDPNTGGAESFSYISLTPAYHSANTMMVDITELREIQGVNEEIFQQLKPYVCAGVDTKPNIININTLTIEQAPLLALIFGEIDEALPAAQAVISQRPLEGFESVEQAWALPNVQDLELKGAGQDMVDIRTDMVKLDTYVELGEHIYGRQTVYKIGGTTGVELVSRRSVD